MWDYFFVVNLPHKNKEMEWWKGTVYRLLPPGLVEGLPLSKENISSSILMENKLTSTVLHTLLKQNYTCEIVYSVQ